jgi:2-keto-4-pentenoate hydratase/2-oxohepta-3-ene-1,7-dioic acid hydratase in catechol pathway
MVVIERYWAVATALARCVPLGAGRPVPEGELQSPVPSAPSIFGFVANYPPAVLPKPPVPMVFGKFPSAVVGLFDNIRLPDPARLSMQAEWTVLEAELAVVIGAGRRHI